MTINELRPGELLMLVLPNKDFKGSLELTVSYEEVLEALKVKKGASKSRRSTTVGRKLSRKIALSTAAIAKGKWSTGAPITRLDVATKMVSEIDTLLTPELKDVTDKALDSLRQSYYDADPKYYGADLMKAWRATIIRIEEAKA